MKKLALTFCFLTPFGLLGGWALVPGHLGVAVAGFTFFAGWLTKYPNFLGINGEVLAGMICIVGASFIPPLAGLLCLGDRSPNKKLLGALFAWELVFFVAILYRLDALAWLFLFDGGLTNIPFLDRLSQVAAPLLRAVGFIGMAALTILKRTFR
jgi:hypothetical protein